MCANFIVIFSLLLSKSTKNCFTVYINTFCLAGWTYVSIRSSLGRQRWRPPQVGYFLLHKRVNQNTKLTRVLCPNFGQPTITSSFTKYISILRVKNSFQLLNLE